MDTEQAQRYEALCRQARERAQRTGQACYVIVWIDGRLGVEQTVDQLTRIFARRITRLEPDGQRRVLTPLRRFV